jgi:hypothetical protein
MMQIADTAREIVSHDPHLLRFGAFVAESANALKIEVLKRLVKSVLTICRTCAVDFLTCRLMHTDAQKPETYCIVVLYSSKGVATMQSLLRRILVELISCLLRRRLLSL